MRVLIQKWGNSFALRIPKKLAEDAKFEQGSEVDLSLDHGNLVAKPVRRKYRLADLVARIKPSNRHAETPWGRARGKEAF